MKMIVNQKKFSKALGRLSRIASKKDTMPVLRHVLLSALPGDSPDGRKLRAVVTDLEVFGEVRIKADDDFGDPLTVEVATLKKVVAALVASKSVSLERVDVEEKDHRGIKDQKIKLVVSGVDLQASFTLPAGDAAEFPAVKSIGGEPRVVPVKDLLSALRATTYAISDDEYRYNINTLNFEPDKEETILVATGGHRMAVARVPFRMFEKETLVPRGMAKELEKALSLVSDDVLVYNNDAYVGFDTGGMMLHAKVVNATYPDWRQVVPKTFTGEFTIDAQALFAGVKRITALASGSLVGVTIKAVDADDESCLKFHANGIDATEKIKTVVKKPGEFTAQKPYILDVAKSLGPGLLRFQTPNDPHSPAKITRADEEDGPFAVVMALRV